MESNMIVTNVLLFSLFANCNGQKSHTQCTVWGRKWGTNGSVLYIAIPYRAELQFIHSSYSYKRKLSSNRLNALVQRLFNIIAAHLVAWNNTSHCWKKSEKQYDSHLTTYSFSIGLGNEWTSLNAFIGSIVFVCFITLTSSGLLNMSTFHSFFILSCYI